MRVLTFEERAGLALLAGAVLILAWHIAAWAAWKIGDYRWRKRHYTKGCGK